MTGLSLVVPVCHMVPAGMIVIRRLDVRDGLFTRLAVGAGSLLGPELDGASQLSSMWPVHLLRLLVVWQVGPKREHSEHLE